MKRFELYYYYHILGKGNMISEMENNRITLAYKLSNKDQIFKVKELEEKYGLNLFPAKKIEPEETLPLLRITKNQLVLEQEGYTLFFHPSMALLRLVNIKRGSGDRFLEATRISEGDTVLDATMGLATDTLIASWAVGEKGKVIALETSPLIHLLVDDGLKRLDSIRPAGITNQEKEEAWTILTQASARIETIRTHHTSYLREMPDFSIDIIYFDPMFRETVEKSAAIKPLKNWSSPEPLSVDTIKQAKRVARKRIILKERRESGEFERLGFELAPGSKYNPIRFGLIELAQNREAITCTP